MQWRERLFGGRKRRDALATLYAAIVANARDPHWYVEGEVPDTPDGRFDMLAAVLGIVLMRIETEGETRADEAALLTELFVEDMDGQLREAGIGDVVVGKHVGKMMGALGGRLGAYRAAADDEGAMRVAIERNVFRGEAPGDDAVRFVARRLIAWRAALFAQPIDAVIAGDLAPLP